ncbi:MAG: acetylxylan esterase, partial [Planctomycetes bacterium]|nr:acetylxylan esterase [Planctomycetota bacterium]
IDATRVGVVGHSRGGKTALWAATMDHRFALAASNCSGCTGAALARRRQGETIQKINVVFPHWFCLNYRKYNDKEDTLPVDQHMLIALIAPQVACVASASEDGWADPLGEFLSIRDAAPVWSLYRKDSPFPSLPPKPDAPVQSGCLSYHLRTGKHNLTAYDWMQYINIAKKVYGMKKQ